MQDTPRSDSGPAPDHDYAFDAVGRGIADLENGEMEDHVQTFDKANYEEYPTWYIENPGLYENDP